MIKDHTVVEGSKTMIGNDDGSQITLVFITERYIYEIPLNSKHSFFPSPFSLVSQFSSLRPDSVVSGV